MIAAIVRHAARAGGALRIVQGWRGDGLSFIIGAVSALGFAPFSLFPLLLLGYGALVLRLDAAARAQRPVWAGFRAGFFFGFGQFLVGLHWIGFAFMVDAASHAWQLPIVALLFPGGLALFPAVAAAAAMVMWRRGAARVFLFAALFGLCEWLRGHVLSGFPWNIAGYAWGALPQVMQGAALFGSYGLGLLTILFGAALADLFRPRPRWHLSASMAGLFVLIFVGGAARLALTPTVYDERIRLRLIQPNIPQAEKYRPEFQARNWRRLTDPTEAKGAGKPDIVIWPEAAPPFLLQYQPEALGYIARLNQTGIVLMTGGIRESGDAIETKYHNSFFAFRGGYAAAVYDKAHLVPFAEYLPFEKTLAGWGLDKLTGIKGRFYPGPGPRSFKMAGLPAFGPLICYEIVFPGAVVGKTRPAWLVNVTDDSWFGPWAGPRQHLLVARMRAIEEGLPLARAANTGISAIIDPVGRIVGRLGLNRQGLLDGGLPSVVAPPPFTLWRGGWFWLLLTLLAALTWRITARK